MIQWRSYSFIVLLVAAFLVVNLVNWQVFSRFHFDLTEEKLYTLSDGSRKMVEKIEEPVTLKFFFSNSLASGIPVLKSYANRIEGLLEHYRSLSDGNVVIEVIDPEPFSDEEDLAVSYGLKGAPIDEAGSKLYLGLVGVNSVDDAAIIPFFHLDRERFLEYDISKLISELTKVEKTKLGVLTTIPMEASSPLMMPGMQGGGNAWVILDQIRQFFDVVMIDPKDKKLPKDINLLMVVQPHTLEHEMFYAIDQYVVGGGKTLIFMDPKSGPHTQITVPDSLSALFDRWGVALDTDHIVLDFGVSGRVPGGVVSDLTELVYEAEQINSEELSTATLNVLTFKTAGHIESEKKEGFIPLVTTTKQVQLVDGAVIEGNQDNKALLRDFVPDDQHYTIAARIQRPVETAFPEHKSRKNHKAVSEGDAHIVITADTDLLRDESWSSVQHFLGVPVLRPYADNSSYVINLLDAYAGSSDLLALRSRGTLRRSFTKVEQIQQQAEQRYLDTEAQLKLELQETEAYLEQLKKQSDGMAMQEQESREIKRFSAKLVEIRKELRAVQRELRKDIEALGAMLKFFNIFLIPIMLVLAAFWFRRKRKINV